MSKQRLIDANALIVKQASIAKTFARSDAQKSLIGRVMYNTENAPTIPAITLDWMREKMDGYAAKLRSTELAALVTVMQMWEQEER